MFVSKRCAIVFSKWGKFLHSRGKRCAMGVGQVHVRWGKLARRVVPHSDGGERLRTAANTKPTSREQRFTLKLPKLDGNPWLRFREKGAGAT